ncbi:hypothetical protein [Halogeometricum borinquense]|nr:hypothetical protein [Halogeometricum borinquense]
MRKAVIRMTGVLVVAMLVLTAFSGGAAALGDDASNNYNVAHNDVKIKQNSGNLGSGASAFNHNNAGVTQVALASQTNTDWI